MTVWLNGNPEPEIAGECESTVPRGPQPLFIAGSRDNLFNFEGKLDEVAVYDRALTAADAAAHYEASGLLPKQLARSPATTKVDPAKAIDP